MKAIVPGHKYELDQFEGSYPQEIQFIHKEPVNGVLTTLQDGTTNEEVLAVLIDRMNYLQSKFACRENAIAITNLEQALMWLEKRTADRKKRNVEGTQQK